MTLSDLAKYSVTLKSLPGLFTTVEFLVIGTMVLLCGM